jgi:hypothetical protein
MRAQWFIALEVFITGMLCMEVGLRLIADGTLHFFRSKSNMFDILVALLCLASLVMLVWLPTWAEYIEEDVTFLLRCLRDLFRLTRLLFLIKKYAYVRVHVHVCVCGVCCMYVCENCSRLLSWYS